MLMCKTGVVVVAKGGGGGKKGSGGEERAAVVIVMSRVWVWWVRVRVTIFRPAPNPHP